MWRTERLLSFLGLCDPTRCVNYKEPTALLMDGLQCVNFFMTFQQFSPSPRSTFRFESLTSSIVRAPTSAHLEMFGLFISDFEATFLCKRVEIK